MDSYALKRLIRSILESIKEETDRTLEDVNNNYSGSVEDDVLAYASSTAKLIEALQKVAST